MAKIQGMSSLIAKFKRLSLDAEAAANKGILKSAKAMAADAKSKAPYGKTGALQASIGVKVEEKKTYFLADIRYSPYVEFGTGSNVEAPIGFEDYALEFKTTGLGHTRPQPFFFPAYFKHQASIVPNIEAELKKVTDKW